MLQAVTAQPATTSEEDAVADFISGLIVSGEYRPGAYGIPEAAIRRHRKVHQYCLDHQEAMGRAPLPELIRRKFPDFPLTMDMPAEWAAHELIRDYRGSLVARALSSASSHLISDEVDAALEVLRDLGSGTAITSARPVDLLDANLMDAELADPCPVAIDPLMDLTGGIAPGELWYIGARPGRGKSWDLVRHAEAATAAGWNAVIFSMEMTAKALQERYLALLFGWDTVLGWREDASGRDGLIEPERERRGSFMVYDPSMIRCDTTAVAAAAASPNTLLLIDYVGLMKTPAGNRSIEDHRIAAAISNELHEIAVAYKAPIIAAAQLNRASERGSSPSLTDLAQTDAAGQDADLVYSITASSGSRVQMSTVVKNRRGESGTRWYTEFRPSIPRFTTISRSRAQTLLDTEASNADLIPR